MVWVYMGTCVFDLIEDNPKRYAGVALKEVNQFYT